MTDNVVTSQPTSNNGTRNTVLDQPPSYEDVISAQPLPNAVGHATDTTANGESLASTNLENFGQTMTFKAEPESSTENAENPEDNERNRNRNRTENCCFVCYVSDDDDWCILCRIFSNCCLYLADCTNSCFENCANGLHNCCESNTQEHQNDSGCCDSWDCCEGDSGCCDSCDCCEGDSGCTGNDCDCCGGDSGCTDNDCDCSCFD